MGAQELLTAVGELSQKCGLWLAGFAKRNAVPLIASGLVALMLMWGWTWYRSWLTENITFLVPRGGNISETEGGQIAAAMESQSNPLGFEYHVDLKERDGYEQIREDIDADRSGRVIGFTQDGFGAGQNVRVLLPLDHSFLFIICRRDFVPQVLQQKGPKLTFSDLLKGGVVIRPGRVYVGIPGTGTRQMATLVMRHFQLDPDKCQTNLVVDESGIRGALNNGSIDLAFYLGHFDSDLIQGVADDGMSTLLGLDGDVDAIIGESVHIFPFEIPANAVLTGPFCPAPIKTLASRRVLCCSSAMDERIAYFIASQAQEAERDTMPEIDWLNPPPGVPRENPLTFQLHPGSDRLKNKQGAPTVVPWSNNYLYMTLGLWLATVVVQKLNSWFRAPTGAITPASAPTEPARSYQETKDVLDNLLHEVERLPLNLEKQQFELFAAKAAEVRLRIVDAARTEQLLDKDASVLFAGLRELEHELELRRPRRRQTKPQGAAGVT